MEQLSGEMKKELKVLTDFVELFCRAKHGNSPRADRAEAIHSGKAHPLCVDCDGLMQYAVERRLRCPLEPKPTCKKCPIHCYGKEYRERIREIMAFSGRRMILRGRLDYIRHFLP
jgi:hypothetical protein